MHRTPRWVKVFVVVGALVALVVVAVVVFGGGEHGPGRHMSPSTATRDDLPPIASSLGIVAPADDAQHVHRFDTPARRD